MKNIMINKRMFSTTSIRRIEAETTLILMEHANTSTPFTLVIVFCSFTFGIGTYLWTHLRQYASDAQHYQMFPDEVADNMYGMFFVPDHIMSYFVRFLSRIENALNYWSQIEHIKELSFEEGKLFAMWLVYVEKMFRKIRTQCEYIVELDDTYINAHLEHLTRDINKLNMFLEKINEINELLVQVFSSM